MHTRARTLPIHTIQLLRTRKHPHYVPVYTRALDYTLVHICAPALRNHTYPSTTTQTYIPVHHHYATVHTGAPSVRTRKTSDYVLVYTRALHYTRTHPVHQHCATVHTRVPSVRTRKHPHYVLVYTRALHYTLVHIRAPALRNRTYPSTTTQPYIAVHHHYATVHTSVQSVRTRIHPCTTLHTRTHPCICTTQPYIPVYHNHATVHTGVPSVRTRK